MNKNTCKCVGELAKKWIEDFLGIEVKLIYMDDYSIELQFWNLSVCDYTKVFNGIEGMCLMYTKLRHLEGKEGHIKQPCLEVYNNGTFPKLLCMHIFTGETKLFADAIGIKYRRSVQYETIQMGC